MSVRVEEFSLDHPTIEVETLRGARRQVMPSGAPIMRVSLVVEGDMVQPFMDAIHEGRQGIDLLRELYERALLAQNQEPPDPRIRSEPPRDIFEEPRPYAPVDEPDADEPAGRVIDLD